MEEAQQQACHNVAFCDSLASLCQQITAREKGLLEAVSAQNDAQIRQIRAELDSLYRQFIFM
jgi:excinuclease ABC subunit B